MVLYSAQAPIGTIKRNRTKINNISPFPPAHGSDLLSRQPSTMKLSYFLAWGAMHQSRSWWLFPISDRRSPVPFPSFSLPVAFEKSKWGGCCIFTGTIRYLSAFTREGG